MKCDTYREVSFYVICFCSHSLERDLKIYTTFQSDTIFWCEVLWHSWSVTAFVFCKRLTESDITVMPSSTCMDYVGDVIVQLI